jgi:hypothetical protein
MESKKPERYEEALKILSVAEVKVLGSIFLSFMLIGFTLTMPTESNSQTRVCPNSSVKCNVTVNHPDHGKITVESEKGANDDAVIIQ